MKRWIALLAVLALMLAAIPGICEQSAEENAESLAANRKNSEMMSALASGGYFDADNEALTEWKTYEEYEEAYARLKREAVLSFQKDQDLPQTGELDETTMDTLIPDYDECRKQEELGNLALGCQGADVAQLQKDLQTLAFYTGDVTGHFGVKTWTAVMAYQKAMDLTEDGYVTSELLGEIHAQAAENL